MRPKKRKHPGCEEDAPASSPRKRPKWKPVQMGVEVLRDFEDVGGFTIDEVSGDAAEILYLEGQKPQQPTDEIPERRKPKRKKKAAKLATPPGDAGTDRAHEQASQEAIASKLPAWLPYDLHPLLMAGLLRLNFRTPTEVQASCMMPAILQRKDIVGAAETGSGKTLAFGLPILHHTLTAIEAAVGELKGGGSRKQTPSTVLPGLRALVILPTRELAVQVKTHMNAVVPKTVQAECFVGGMSIQKQLRLLKRRPRIVVATPGRLSALLGLSKQAKASERCDWLRESLRGLRHLVLDEADRLIECGHFKELDAILSLVYDSLERPQQLQTFVFSATLTLDFRAASQRRQDGGKVENLVQRLQFRDARAVHTVDLTTPGTGAAREGALNARLPETLLFHELTCGTETDRQALVTMWLLRRYRWEHLRKEAGIVGGNELDAHPSPGGRSILFVNAISSVARLTTVFALILESPNYSRVLSTAGLTQKEKTKKVAMPVEVLGLHSKMRQKDRLNRIERFEKLEHVVLVATDIAARGLDVPGIGAVLHYHPPRNTDVFVHRSGRTARAGLAGESIAFVCPADAPPWSRVYRAIGITKERIKEVRPTAFEVGAARETARLAIELERQLHRTAKNKKETSWIRRTVKDADVILSDEEDVLKTPKAAPKHTLEDLHEQLVDRVRRLPKRLGGAPLPHRLWRRHGWQAKR